jgi:putative transposase
MPQHVTQRGSRGQPTLFCEEANAADGELLAAWCQQRGVEVWANCLMPNHGHGIAVPQSEHRLRLAMGEAHRRYPRQVNSRHCWRGYWWPERFASFVMDEPDLPTAARDVELDPVRAKLVAAPSPYRWSSARAHPKGKDDALVRVAPRLEIAGSWRRLLTSAVSAEELEEFRAPAPTGRVLGDQPFPERLEPKLGRVLRRHKPGPKQASKRSLRMMSPNLSPGSCPAFTC